LSLTRHSTLGVNALGLNLLANWFEAPRFPSGFGDFFITNPIPDALHLKLISPPPGRRANK
jgi:hypothetical protein